MNANLARTPGYKESDLKPRGGIRREQFQLFCSSSQTHNVNARPIGGAASAAVVDFTALTVNNRSNPFCGTLVALIAQSSNTTGTVRLRIRGFDLWGQYQEELTPTVNLVAKTNNYIYLAKLWSYVNEVAFVCTGLDIAGDTISLGTRWDWTRTIDATNEHHAGRNLGLGIPYRLGHKPDGPVAASTWLQPPGAGGIATDQGGNGVSSDVFIHDFQPRWSRGPRGYARAFMLIAAPPANNDTVTIDGLVYTWKTTITTAARDVQIGANVIACSANFIAALEAAPGQSGVAYGSLTTAHPTVTTSMLIESTGSIGIVARRPGARGNLIAVSDSSANISWMSTVTALRGGYDYPVEVTGLSVYDFTGAASAGALTNHNPTQYAIGWNESGWSGPGEKLHMLYQSDVAQWAVADNVMVTMSVNTQDTIGY